MQHVWGSASGRLLLALCCANSIANEGAAPQLAPATFARLAEELEIQAGLTQRVRIGVGQFINAHNNGLTAFSNLLRDGIETALSSRRKSFEVISRNQLRDLQNELEFQKQKAEFSVKAIDGLVRGSYFTTREKILIFAEIAWLDGGRITKAQMEVSRSDVQEDIYWEDRLHAPLNQDKIRLHILASSFSADAVRDNPEWVRHLKASGCEFAIWTTLERLLSEHPAFELFVEAGDISNTELMKQLVGEAETQGSPRQASAVLSVNTKVFVNEAASDDLGNKKRATPKKSYTIQLDLRLFNPANKPWNRNPAIASGLAENAANPLSGAQEAAKRAVAELLQRLRGRGVI